MKSTKKLLLKILLVIFFIVFAVVLIFFNKSTFYISKLDNFILDAPPVYGSVAYQQDNKEYLYWYGMKGSFRWEVAMSDASYRNFDRRLSKVFGINFTEKTTPAIYEMLRIIQKSSIRVVGRIKRDYNRIRPYIVYKHLDCVLNGNDVNKNSGSYPSGHASFAWASAMALSDIKPKQREEIMYQAFDYSQSRVVCGSHWLSDINEGKKVGEAIYSELKKHSEFTDVMWRAKAEYRFLSKT